MKLLVISHMYPSPRDHFGGIFVHQQVRALSRLCDVKVISPKPWAPRMLWLRRKWRQYGRDPDRDVLDGIEVFYPKMLHFPRSFTMQWYGYYMYWAVRQLVAEIEAHFEFDLIHCHVALPDGFGGMLVNRRYNRKLVVSVHGQDLARTVFRNRACRAAVERVFAQADAVVTVSGKLASMASGHCSRSCRVRTISDGVYLDQVARPDPQLRARYRGASILLAVGSLIQTKGFDLLLEALAKVVRRTPNVKLVVIGSGPQEHKLRALAGRLGIEQHVDFLGLLPHQEVMRFMAVCDVFVLPSWSEGFGVVYLEAMASGKPVIACRGEGIEDVVEDGESGLLVRPRDAADVERALSKLLADETCRHAMGDRASKRVQGFTWEIVAQQTMDLYRELLGPVVGREEVGP